MNAQSDSVGCSLALGNATLRRAFVYLRYELVFVIQPKSGSEYHSEVLIFIFLYDIIVESGH